MSLLQVARFPTLFPVEVIWITAASAVDMLNEVSETFKYKKLQKTNEL